MRTRNVHPADMVAHLWAHKSQDSPATPAITSTSTGTQSIATVPISPSRATSKQARAARFSSPPVAIRQLRPVISVWWKALADT